jgi:hypothetical protein
MWFEGGPWWRDWLGSGTNRSGRCVSDLVARQTWLYSNDPAIVLVYCDQEDAERWAAQLPPGQLSSGWTRTVPHRLAAFAARALADVFKSDLLPPPSAYTWHDWPYGTQFWKRSSHVPTLARLALRPFGARCNVFVGGDSYSIDAQGWGEGALKVGNDVLRAMGVADVADLSATATGLSPLRRQLSYVHTRP